MASLREGQASPVPPDAGSASPAPESLQATSISGEEQTPLPPLAPALVYNDYEVLEEPSVEAAWVLSTRPDR